VELVREFPFEIISVDSALVYRGLDIGSGKPDANTLELAPHRLIDIRDPAEPYSAAEFRSDAIREIKAIQAKGKIPLLVGGTMLYFKVLRDGMASMPAATPEVRQKISALAQQEGWAAVHQRLQEVDPVAAQRIHPNDPQRLQRALEVYEVSGLTLTHLHQNAVQELELPCELIFLAMLPVERKKLHEQIAQRFLTMLESGLLQEVETLKRRNDLNSSMPSIRSVGYRQVWDYLDGKYDHATMVAKGTAATRQLAKRQLTWLRSWDDLHRIDCELDSQDVIFVKNHLKFLRLVANY